MNEAARISWLLLILSLPTQSATGRMRIWRALKAQGCAALRDGAYLLPASAEHETALRDLAEECLREGGSAWLLSAAPSSADDAQAYPALFNRSEEYASLVGSWKQAAATLPNLEPVELARLQKKLRRDYDALRAIDFFPGEASVEAEAAWTDFNNRLERLLSPDEPHESNGQVPRLDLRDYQGRLWATRKRMWVDRVASAWLIQRFIDRDARFQWLSRPSECPRKALGFDFDGATFSHVGERVTFEVLMASFGLDEDPALVRLGAMVHSLDVGGEPVPEASGFEAVLTGARERAADDDALLVQMSSWSMPMPVMLVRDMRMCMPRGFVAVQMAVDSGGHRLVMMRVMPIVVGVSVLMLQRLVFVRVALRQVKHDAQHHQRRTGKHPHTAPTLAEQIRKHCPDEGRECEHRAGPRCAERALRQQVEAQAQPVPGRADREQGQGLP